MSIGSINYDETNYIEKIKAVEHALDDIKNGLFTLQN